MIHDLQKLEAELLFCDAQILFGKAAIKKYELEKIDINKKIQELQWSGSSNPVSISKRNVVYTDDGETVLLKSWSDDEKSVDNPNKKDKEKKKMSDNNTKE